ncbi:MAG: hypothetical protein JWP89_4877 [Schlesneria sp.]|nr:hypothetical protein [Schlesneria sp.]
MPEFRGKKTTNEVLASKSVSRWKSVTLSKTSVDDKGLIDLCHRAPNLEELHIASDLLTDVAMGAICSLPKLKSLLLDGVPNVGDLGIANVSRIADLRELYLNGTQLTDEGVKAITSAKHLWSLSLKGTKITDTGVALLGKSAPLGILVLDGTPVHGSTLAELNLGDRASLHLGGCPIDDAAVEKLIQAHPQIETLDLSGTHVTDGCMPVVADLKGLCGIQLHGTDVSDRGLEQLHNHPMLSMIYLQNTAASDDAVSEFRSSFDRHVSIYQ